MGAEENRTPSETDQGSGRLRVVIGVDFHEPSNEAVTWVMRHFAPGAAYELVHVVDLPELPGALRGLGSNQKQLQQVTRSEAQRRLEELGASGVDERVRIHILQGRPASELVGLAEKVRADLIVVGEQGPRRGMGALLGSTAERVLYDSTIPTLVARKVPDSPPRRLLIALDDSEMTQPLLARARQLLGSHDAEATVLNVIDRVLLSDQITGIQEAGSFQRLEEEARAAMQKWLSERTLEAGLPERRVRTRVGVGEPSYEIIAEAARMQADLVVIGSRGGDVARTPLIGRIVNKVVRSAPCSVLVVTNR